MKRELFIGAVVLPLAFFAGRIGGGAGDSPQASSKLSAPTKASDRTADAHRESGKSTSPAWSILRKRAALTTDELLEELFAQPDFGPLSDPWLIDQLLAKDPERLFREMYRRTHGGLLVAVTRRWCSIDPERALPLLLGNKEPFAWRGREFYDPHPPVQFTAIGFKDPEKGLAMIDALPPGQRRKNDYSSLLQGIADGAPDKAFGYFEQILAKGNPPDEQLQVMLRTVATADPQAALDWAKERQDPVPPTVMASVLEGMAKTDPGGAARLYEEASPKPGGNSLSSIQIELARSSPDLDTTWQWLERNLEPGKLAQAKASALAQWARKNPDAAIGRILANPELLAEDKYYGLARIVRTNGQVDQVLALAEQLPSDKANALKMQLRSVGALLPDANASSTPSHQQVLALMHQNPEQAEEQWQSFSDDQRRWLINSMCSDTGSSIDPQLLLKRLTEAKADLGSDGGRQALMRLSLADPGAAARLVEDMPSGESRNKMIELIHKNWAVDDVATATKWRDRAAAGQ